MPDDSFLGLNWELKSETLKTARLLSMKPSSVSFLLTVSRYTRRGIRFEVKPMIHACGPRRQICQRLTLFERWLMSIS